MRVIKASLVAATVHGLRMISNLVILKLIAVYVGPVGLGVLGNFMSLTTIATVFAGGGISNGITKYVAEYSLAPLRRIRFIQSALVYGTFFSIAIFLISLFFSKNFSIYIFGNEQQAWLLPFFGLAQFFCFIGTGTVAIANGQQRYDIFAKICISAYLALIPVSWFLIIFYKVDGAAIALLLTIACTSVPAMYFIARSGVFNLIRFKLAHQDARNLLRFSIMLLASALFFPSAEIFIRHEISAQLGALDTGIWQAINRLSGAYLGFFSVFLSTYYMPKLSRLVEKKEILKEIQRHLVLIGVVFITFGFGLYFFKDFAIQMLFAKSFMPVGDHIGLELAGDFFRILSYVIGFLGVAKASVYLYVCAELLQTLLYTSLTWLALHHGGNLHTVMQGYLLTYVIYFLTTILALYIYSRKAK